MIIVCSGPDTYRAREKARELVRAFREKHDPSGLSTEIVSNPPDAATILSKIGGGSLFSKKRLVRMDGCLGELGIKDIRRLRDRLEQDADATILLTVETDPPSEKTREALKKAPLFHYPFVALRGNVFRIWVSEQAQMMKVSPAIAARIADTTDGDSWLAVSEIQKAAANPAYSPDAQQEGGYSTFDRSDFVLGQSQGWRRHARELFREGGLPLLVTQMRSVLRIKDEKASGVHPYVAKKLSRFTTHVNSAAFLTYERLLFGSRSGLHADEEADVLL